MCGILVGKGRFSYHRGDCGATDGEPLGRRGSSVGPCEGIVPSLDVRAWFPDSFPGAASLREKPRQGRSHHFGSGKAGGGAGFLGLARWRQHDVRVRQLDGAR